MTLYAGTIIDTPGDPFAGRIDLTFRADLPAGTYSLIVHSGPTANASGIRRYRTLRLAGTAAAG